MKSRRKFLNNLGMLLFSGAATRSNTGIGQEQFAFSDAGYWDLVRAQFSFEESAVPMNAANLCPSFRSVSNAVSSLTQDIDKDCSFNNRSKFGTLLEESRDIIARQLNVDTDEIALVRNTSEANNIINNGLTLSAGDEVVLWDQNHPTNNIAWSIRAERFGFSVKRVTSPTLPKSEQELLDLFVSHFSANTKVVALTYVSNTSGVKLPIKAIASAARARGIYVHVDGAQVWGAMPLDLDELGIDSFSASSHKWLMGPKEVGLLYINRNNIDRIWPNIISAGWGNESATHLKGAKKFESLGQRNDSALAAVGTTVKQLELIGLQRIEARTVELSQLLKEGVVEAGIELITPIDPILSHGVCIMEVPSEKRSEIVDSLYQNFGIAGAPTGGLRLCPAIYNTKEHVERAIAAVQQLLG